MNEGWPTVASFEAGANTPERVIPAVPHFVGHSIGPPCVAMVRFAVGTRGGLAVRGASPEAQVASWPTDRYNAPMLDDHEIALCKTRLSGLSVPIRLGLDPGPDPSDRFSQVLCAVSDAITTASDGQVRFEVRTDEGPYGRRPCLTLGSIRYLAIPKGPELLPFLDLLLAWASPTEAVDADLPAATIEVLMAPTCPNCPAVVRTCLLLAAPRPQLALAVVDVQYFADLAGPVRSVPTVIVDGLLTLTGPVSSDELRRALVERGSPEAQARALGSMIEADRMQAALGLLDRETGMQALARLLSAGTLKDRMSVLLLAETALGEDPHSLDRAVPFLLPLLSASDGSVRGDTADLLGKIGAPGAAAALRALLSDENPDVREVAAEALEQLRQPS